MTPAAFRALEIFRNSQGPSEILEKRAFDYAGAAGWQPERASFDSMAQGGGGYGDEGGQDYSGPGGGPGGQGDQTPSGEPGGATGEAQESFLGSMVPKDAQGVANAARMFTPGGMAGMAAQGPLLAAGAGAALGTVGGAVTAARGKGFASGAKSMSGYNAIKDVWNTVKSPAQTAKALVSGATPAATGAGRILPGVGAAIGMAQSGYGAVTGDQNYGSDGFWGQMGEQGMRTVGNLMSGAKLGPKGLMAVGAAEAANVGANAGRAVGAAWDAGSSARKAGDMAQKTLGKVQGGMQQGTKDWLDQQEVTGKSDSSWYNPFSWGSGNTAETTSRKAWAGSKMKQFDEGLASGSITQGDYDQARKHMGTLLSKYDPSAETQSEDFRAADSGFSALSEGLRATPKSPPAPAADSSGSTTPSPVNKK